MNDANSFGDEGYVQGLGCCLTFVEWGKKCSSCSKEDKRKQGEM